MRTAKIQLKNQRQTPTVPLENNSYLEIYTKDDGTYLRPVIELEPKQKDGKTPIQQKFYTRYSKRKISDKQETIKLTNQIRSKPKTDEIELELMPGTRKEEKYNFRDFKQLKSSIASPMLNNYFKKLCNSEKRTFTDDIYEMAKQHHEHITKKPFSNWLREMPDLVYQTLTDNIGKEVNEFAENGAFYDQIQQIKEEINLEGGTVMRGDEEIRTVNSEPNEKINYKLVDGILVPDEDQNLEEYLGGFR